MLVLDTYPLMVHVMHDRYLVVAGVISNLVYFESSEASAFSASKTSRLHRKHRAPKV